MEHKRDYYQILHVHPDAPREIIKSSYRTLMQRMKMHPDLGGDNASAAAINEAYAVLMEPANRAAYDQSLETFAKATHGAANDERAQAHSSRNSHSSRKTERPAQTDKKRANTKTSSQSSCQFCSAPFAAANGMNPHECCTMCSSPRFMAEQLQEDDSDRRAILRVPKDRPVSIFTRWPQSEPYVGRTDDISLTGMRFRCVPELEIGQTIKVDTQMFRAVAEVTRIQPQAVGTGWEVGVKFVSLYFEQSRGAFVTDCV